jgi:hypothetical protein
VREFAILDPDLNLITFGEEHWFLGAKNSKIKFLQSIKQLFKNYTLPTL